MEMEDISDGNHDTQKKGQSSRQPCKWLSPYPPRRLAGQLQTAAALWGVGPGLQALKYFSSGYELALLDR